MQWLLIMVLVSPTNNIDFEPLKYASEAECRAAAAAVMETNPVFEWREYPAGETVQEVEEALSGRSYVTCIPATEKR